MHSAATLPIIVVKQSDNKKISSEFQKASATYGRIGPPGDPESTCPNDCPLRQVIDPETGKKTTPCYGQRGRCNRHQETAAAKESSLLELIGAPFVRHHVTGDAFKQTKDGRSVLDLEKVRAMLDFHRVSKNSRGWNYTHRFTAWEKAGFGPDAWPENFVTLASVHDLKTKAAANALGWLTARVIDKPEDATADEFLCPVDLAKYKRQKPKTNCVTCQKCLPGANRNIAFIKF